MRPSDDDELVILASSPLRQSSISDVYRAETGEYLRLRSRPRADGLTGAGVTAAVVDSGVMLHHPDIAPRLRRSVDLSGEGPEDEIGHGTKVALILLAGAPGTDLVNVKVVGRKSKAGADRLLQALRLIRDDAEIDLVNLSAGVYRPACDGDCDLCAGAREVTAAGKIVFAAAGNLPGITACPAKASDAVVTIAAVEHDGQLASYSSPATEEGFGQVVPDARELFDWSR